MQSFAFQTILQDKVSKEKGQDLDIKTEGEDTKEDAQLLPPAPPQFPWIPVLEPL
jgi:hypothetical protein